MSQNKPTKIGNNDIKRPVRPTTKRRHKRNPSIRTLMNTKRYHQATPKHNMMEQLFFSPHGTVDDDQKTEPQMHRLNSVINRLRIENSHTLSKANDLQTKNALLEKSIRHTRQQYALLKQENKNQKNHIKYLQQRVQDMKVNGGRDDDDLTSIVSLQSHVANLEDSQRKSRVKQKKVKRSITDVINDPSLPSHLRTKLVLLLPNFLVSDVSPRMPLTSLDNGNSNSYSNNALMNGPLKSLEDSPPLTPLSMNKSIIYENKPDSPDPDHALDLNLDLDLSNLHDNELPASQTTMLTSTSYEYRLKKKSHIIDYKKRKQNHSRNLSLASSGIKLASEKKIKQLLITKPKKLNKNHQRSTSSITSSSNENSNQSSIDSLYLLNVAESDESEHDDEEKEFNFINKHKQTKGGPQSPSNSNTRRKPPPPPRRNKKKPAKPSRYRARTKKHLAKTQSDALTIANMKHLRDKILPKLPLNAGRGRGGGSGSGSPSIDRFRSISYAGHSPSPTSSLKANVGSPHRMSALNIFNDNDDDDDNGKTKSRKNKIRKTPKRKNNKSNKNRKNSKNRKNTKKKERGRDKKRDKSKYQRNKALTTFGTKSIHRRSKSSHPYSTNESDSEYSTDNENFFDPYSIKKNRFFKLGWNKNKNTNTSDHQAQVKLSKNEEKNLNTRRSLLRVGKDTVLSMSHSTSPIYRKKRHSMSAQIGRNKKNKSNLYDMDIDKHISHDFIDEDILFTQPSLLTSKTSSAEPEDITMNTNPLSPAASPGPLPTPIRTSVSNGTPIIMNNNSHGYVIKNGLLTSPTDLDRCGSGSNDNLSPLAPLTKKSISSPNTPLMTANVLTAVNVNVKTKKKNQSKYDRKKDISIINKNLLKGGLIGTKSSKRKDSDKKSSSLQLGKGRKKSKDKFSSRHGKSGSGGFNDKKFDMIMKHPTLSKRPKKSEKQKRFSSPSIIIPKSLISPKLSNISKKLVDDRKGDHSPIASHVKKKRRASFSFKRRKKTDHFKIDLDVDDDIKKRKKSQEINKKNRKKTHKKHGRSMSLRGGKLSFSNKSSFSITSPRNDDKLLLNPHKKSINLFSGSSGSDSDDYMDKVWTLKDLIREMVSIHSDDYMDHAYSVRNALILCHISFTSSTVLFQELRRFFRMSITEMTSTILYFDDPDDDKYKNDDDRRWFMRQKITESIIYWLEEYWIEDFSSNKELKKEVEFFKSDIRSVMMNDIIRSRTLIQPLMEILKVISTEYGGINVKNLNLSPKNYKRQQRVARSSVAVPVKSQQQNHQQQKPVLKEKSQQQRGSVIINDYIPSVSMDDEKRDSIIIHEDITDDDDKYDGDDDDDNQTVISNVSLVSVGTKKKKDLTNLMISKRDRSTNIDLEKTSVPLITNPQIAQKIIDDRKKEEYAKLATELRKVEARWPDLYNLDIVIPHNFNIMELDPEDVAIQLTLLDSFIFQKIKKRECIEQSWKKKDKALRAPNILKMIAQFNDVSKWVQITILQGNKARDRKRYIKKMIIMAKHFLHLGNLSSLCAFHNALTSTNINQLQSSWKLLSKSSKRDMSEIKSLFGWKMNKFKEMQSELTPPCIPHIGIFLQVLFQIDEGKKNLNTVNGGINYIKMMLLYEQINKLQILQSTNYDYEPNYLIQKLLIKEFNLHHKLTDTHLYKLAKTVAISENK